MTRVLAQRGESSSLRLFSFKVFDVIVYTLEANSSFNRCVKMLVRGEKIPLDKDFTVCGGLNN